MSLRRSISFYIPSADPCGMGAPMPDLVAEYVGMADVSLKTRSPHRAGWLLDRAAALGVRTVVLPSPRDPAFGGSITDFLRAHPADVFHCHVGTGRQGTEGRRRYEARFTCERMAADTSAVYESVLAGAEVAT